MKIIVWNPKGTLEDVAVGQELSFVKKINKYDQNAIETNLNDEFIGYVMPLNKLNRDVLTNYQLYPMVEDTFVGKVADKLEFTNGRIVLEVEVAV